MTIEKKMFDAVTKHLLEDDCPSEYLKTLSGLPEFELYPFNMLLDLKDTEQNPEHHPEGNVWDHTMLVVDAAAVKRTESKNPKVFMWAALLHDIGKPAATIRRNGRLTAYDHDKIGEKLSKKFVLSTGNTEFFAREVSSMVRYHMHLLFVTKEMPYCDLKGLKENTDISEIALLGFCDRMGRAGAIAEKEEARKNTFLLMLKD